MQNGRTGSSLIGYRKMFGARSTSTSLPTSMPTSNKSRSLEARVAAHVAFYRPGAVGWPTGLCKTFKVADLGPEAVSLLKEAEKRNPGAVFVAYSRPLTRL